jgi:hypothetical protein
MYLAVKKMELNSGTRPLVTSNKVTELSYIIIEMVILRGTPGYRY